MSSVTSAAATGGVPMLVFALSVAGALILMLVGVVGWMFKSRVKSRERYEELLEKRLADGAVTMRALKDEIAQLSNNFLNQLGKALPAEKFDAYQASHEVVHEAVDRRMDELKDLNNDLKVSMAGLRATMDALNRILARIVDVDGAPGKLLAGLQTEE